MKLGLRLREKKESSRLRHTVLSRKEEQKNTGRNKKLDVLKLKSELRLKGLKEKNVPKKLVKKV